MSRSGRSRLDFDYRILHSTGERVPIVRTSQPEMDEQQRHAKAVDSVSDVDDLLSSYTLEELVGEEELHEFILRIESTKREFRRVHAQLKDSDGANFATKYSYYEGRMAELDALFKKASKKLSELRILN